MKFIKTDLPEVIVIEPNVFGDNRGYFLETYRKDLFFQNGIKVDFIQDNFSFSKKNILRGIHFQEEPYSQDKLVRLVEGEVFDVAVDLRRNSPNFGKWVAEHISEENKKMMFVPKGFGHGFCVISEQVKFEYKCSAYYNPESERTILWDDPTLSIKWPITNPILSNKDEIAPTFKDFFKL
jgi:dTDP-4-dehydrorhamnose 3,5-epimerase